MLYISLRDRSPNNLCTTYNDFGLGGRKLGNFASLRHQEKERKRKWHKVSYFKKF